MKRNATTKEEKHTVEYQNRRHTQQYQAELRRGVTGNGATNYCLFIMDGIRTIAVHRFTTKTEAYAFHRSGTNYEPLIDFS